MITFYSWFILLANFIPISLILSLELVKGMQAYYINNDEDLSSVIDGKLVQAKTFNQCVNEDLGMIEYLFMDKTGTMTRNEVELRVMMIGDMTYGDSNILHQGAYKVKATHVDHKSGIRYTFKDTSLLQMITKQTTGKPLDYRLRNARGQVMY